MKTTAKTALTILVFLLATRVHAQADVPLRTRNLSPPIAIFGLPAWQPRAYERTVGATLEIANHYRLSRRDEDFLLLDGETTRFNLFAEFPIANVWSVGVEVPVVRQDGGILDDAVDGWHSVFNLPDGGRNARPEGVVEYLIGRGNRADFALRNSGTGIGDVRVSAAREIGRNAAYTLRLGLKLDSGDDTLLAGSGGTDVILTLLRNRRFVLRRRDAGLYWGAGVVLPGDAVQVSLPDEDLVLTGIFGGGINVTENLGFKAQLEVHTPYFDTPLEELGQTSVQISLGGWRRVGQSAVLDFAVGEDLHVSTAPDVMFHAGIRWQWQ